MLYEGVETKEGCFSSWRKIGDWNTNKRLTLSEAVVSRWAQTILRWCFVCISIAVYVYVLIFWSSILEMNQPYAPNILLFHHNKTFLHVTKSFMYSTCLFSKPCVISTIFLISKVYSSWILHKHHLGMESLGPSLSPNAICAKTWGSRSRGTQYIVCHQTVTEQWYWGTARDMTYIFKEVILVALSVNRGKCKRRFLVASKVKSGFSRWCWNNQWNNCWSMQTFLNSSTIG